MVNGAEGTERSHSVLAGALHYANLVALVGIGLIFLSIFLGAGVLQLTKMPVAGDENYSYYYDDDLRGQSVWDYMWENIDSQSEVKVSRQAGYITCFTLALVVVLLCAAISRKMMKDGPTMMLTGVTIGLCAIGAGILHSWASVLFVIPVVMAIPLLVETLQPE